MNFIVAASGNSFNYAKLLEERFHNQWKDIITTQPDIQELIHSQNIPNKIPDRNTRRMP